MDYGYCWIQKQRRNMLNIRDLDVQFQLDDNIIHAVKGISYDVQPGQSVGIVGESGSGKSVSALAIMGLLPASASIKGTISFHNNSLLQLPDDEYRRIRGKKIGYIFQNPLAALNPVFTIANQMIETIQLHHSISKDAARSYAIELLDKVKIVDPQKRIDDYPHQFSIGMCQRIMIAMTLSMKPELLIADEPTASLDVTTQKEILELIDELKTEYNMAMIFISHDLAVVAERCDHVAVMYLGNIVEQGNPRQIFTNPQNEYTKLLIDAIPKISF
ncbi:peptide ABC transporter ATP-binding protein [Candidatus Marinamargulisbacteria bacterium SCGC AG-343-K17]|nr:peptide ABC transporter ATP-binding protein [Candidatus Marinamargulisbacteria bacterium SCGC AG-343-K17]